MKGICFKEPLFHATIEGRKTQTRRIINPQPDDRGLRTTNVMYEDWHGKEIKPRYKVGEIIYLKEPYIITGQTFEYKYLHENKTDIDCIESNGGYKNKLFMPKSAARYFIKITNVRVERLQDISDKDCMKEGVIRYDYGINLKDDFSMPGLDDSFETPREAYAALIDKINGEGTWDNNPWVWVYDYELTEISDTNGTK